MTFDDTRDNTTAIENQIREADAHEDTRDVWAGTDIYIDEGDAREDGPTWDECQCEHCTTDDDGSIAAALFAQPHFGG